MQRPEFVWVFLTPLYIQTVIILFKIVRRKKVLFYVFWNHKVRVEFFFEGKYHKQQITASHIYMSHLSKMGLKKKKIAAGVSSGLHPKWLLARWQWGERLSSDWRYIKSVNFFAGMRLFFLSGCVCVWACGPSTHSWHWSPLIPLVVQKHLPVNTWHTFAWPLHLHAGGRDRKDIWGRRWGRERGVTKGWT